MEGVGSCSFSSRCVTWAAGAPGSEPRGENGAGATADEMRTGSNAFKLAMGVDGEVAPSGTAKKEWAILSLSALVILDLLLDSDIFRAGRRALEPCCVNP